MAVFRDLLRRWGFVKLERYGLVVTPDDRIVSTRPAALNDGAGGRIVGWRDDDLAMAELAPWRPDQAPRPAPRPAPEPAAHAPAQGPMQFPAMPPIVRVEVAAEAPVDEDDWEWTIALARARAAAEEPETVAPVPPSPAPQSAVPPAAAPLEKPAKAAARNRTTRQLPTVEEPWERAHSPATRSPSPSPARVAPATVIPVPHLPSILDVGRSTWMEPVVRTTVTAGPPAPAPPNRLAKGTAPIDADTEQVPALSEDTVQSFPIGDHTTPGIGMPLVARTVALSNPKRRDDRRR